MSIFTIMLRFLCINNWICLILTYNDKTFSWCIWIKLIWNLVTITNCCLILICLLLSQLRFFPALWMWRIYYCTTMAWNGLLYLWWGFELLSNELISNNWIQIRCLVRISSIRGCILVEIILFISWWREALEWRIPWMRWETSLSLNFTI